jgi:hypothetical protein
MSAEKTSGLDVDWEMKAFMMVTVYAALNFCGSSSYIPDILILAVARGFFLLGHVALIKIFIDVNAQIKDAKLSLDQKVKAKGAVQNTFKSLCARAVVIAIIHGRSQMLPPLFISVFMGSFALLENRECYHVMYSKAPKLFEVVFSIPAY